MSGGFMIPYRGQGSTFDETDIEAATRLLRSGHHLSSGVERTLFEEEFAGHTGAAHAVTTTSCTMALELSTHLLGLSPGDEVIASPLTFQATVAPLLSRNVVVRFADISPLTLGLDVDSATQLISARTRALYVTHYGGLPADLDALADLAAAHGVALVEDCAHALGARYRGRRTGTMGDLGCWSFHSLKNISTLGQGGMVTTKRDDWAHRLRRITQMEPDADYQLRDRPVGFGPHSVPRPDDPERHAKNAYTHDCLAIRMGGLNSVLSEPAAAVGRTQLRRLPAFIRRRRQIAHYLNERLAALPGVLPHHDLRDSEHAYHLYTFRLLDAEPGLRDALVRRLQHHYGIEIVLRYFPLHLLPEWRARGGHYGQAPVAERIWFRELVNLPIYPTLTDREVTYMADAVECALAEVQRSSAWRGTPTTPAPTRLSTPPSAPAP